MKRDKTLGQDPLAWIKVTKEAEGKKAGEDSKPEGQETPGLEATHPESKKFKEVEVAKEEAKESPPTEKPQPAQKTIEAKQERIHVTPEQGYMTAKEGVIEGGVKTPYSTARTNVSTVPLRKEKAGSSIIFIIAYAFLLLILMLFVYSNLSKKIDNLNSRISIIEKAQNVGFKEKSTMR